MKTKSGKHVIFDVTDPKFHPGDISLEFIKEVDSSGGKNTWFFQPSHWFPYGTFYGSIVHTRQKMLMMYSPGYSTFEVALAAAEEWESEEEQMISEPVNWFTISL